MPALWLVIPLVLSLSFIEGAVGRPFYPLPSKVKEKNRLPLQSFRPYNIAHRGSNGEIPEETAEAYMRAIEEGADFIETDILATKDGKLICFHDVILDETTDIANHKEFVNRKRTYEVQGQNITGWFVVDFTLEELKSLRVRQRYAFRDQQYNGMFSIITFEEFIAIALDAKRVVGIYPEIKNPVLINQHETFSRCPLNRKWNLLMDASKNEKHICALYICNSHCKSTQEGFYSGAEAICRLYDEKHENKIIIFRLPLILVYLPLLCYLSRRSST